MDRLAQTEKQIYPPCCVWYNSVHLVIPKKVSFFNLQSPLMNRFTKPNPNPVLISALTANAHFAVTARSQVPNIPDSGPINFSSVQIVSTHFRWYFSFREYQCNACNVSQYHISTSKWWYSPSLYSFFSFTKKNIFRHVSSRKKYKSLGSKSKNPGLLGGKEVSVLVSVVQKYFC